MESIRRNSLEIKNNQAIEIFDLGLQASDMLRKWKKLNMQDIQVSIKEFPDVDFYQKIDDKRLMEVILEFAVIIEENKRIIAKQRQAKGIAEARRKGIKLGRREKEIPVNFESIYKRVTAKKISIKTAIEILDVDYKTYRKWVQRHSEVEKKHD